jgi:hypothetical protein
MVSAYELDAPPGAVVDPESPSVKCPGELSTTV